MRWPLRSALQSRRSSRDRPEVRQIASIEVLTLSRMPNPICLPVPLPQIHQPLDQPPRVRINYPHRLLHLFLFFVAFLAPPTPCPTSASFDSFHRGNSKILPEQRKHPIGIACADDPPRFQLDLAPRIPFAEALFGVGSTKRVARER